MLGVDCVEAAGDWWGKVCGSEVCGVSVHLRRFLQASGGWIAEAPGALGGLDVKVDSTLACC